MQCLKDRTDYAMNGEKTEEGKYISSYQCNPELVDLEFAQAKKEYLHKTWRQPKGDVIAYQIRQSFKPGEITPEEANEVGYETGMRFTKGKHAFIVATHVDRAHIHNHIIFNSTNLECDRKFRDFWFSGIALQRLSDIICLEHGLSIIPKAKPSERQKRTKYPDRVSMRDVIREDILKCLEQRPADFEEFLKLLQTEGYEVKRGKHTAVCGKEQKTHKKKSKEKVPDSGNPLSAIMPLYQVDKKGKKKTYKAGGPNWGNQNGNVATKQDAMEACKLCQKKPRERISCKEQEKCQI